MASGADAITQRLVDWAELALPGVQVMARASRDPAGDQGVEVRLLSIAPIAQPRMSNPPDELALDYLIAVRSSDALEEHRLAAELTFAALGNTDIMIVADRTTAEANAALGLAPAAGLVVRAVLSRAREKARAPLVRFPLKSEIAGVGLVQGVVLGPQETPIAGAQVTAPGLNRGARTGADGRFRIPGPLPDTVPIRLIARARGVEIEAVASPGEPTVMHLPLET